MKIDGTAHSTLQPNLAGEVPVRSKNGKTNAPSQDSVSLSEASTLLSSVESRVQQAPDFDAAKVESIRRALSEGRYAFDAERIARNLLSSSLDLLVRQRSA
ncbi:MAG: flagellar biosynthesis anti-sigma factor FlgM [Methylophilaceae bacterium]|nr:flagellar biosynthesis anti-sigma factor FlgM [Methylophilaceae bacterium]